MSTVEDLRDKLHFSATSEADEGANYERLTEVFFQADMVWAERFANGNPWIAKVTTVSVEAARRGRSPCPAYPGPRR